jgi:hypothetical protein
LFLGGRRNWWAKLVGTIANHALKERKKERKKEMLLSKIVKYKARHSTKCQDGLNG